MNNRIRMTAIVFFAIFFFVFGWLSHTAYSPADKNGARLELEKILKSKTLNVVLLNSQSTYYIGADGPQGFEYDLLVSYAKHLGVKLNITTAKTTKEAIELSKNPNIHITSASLTKTKEREKKLNFGPSYFEVQEQMVCNREMLWGDKFPKSVEDLAGLKITVGEATSYRETIHRLQEDGFDINATYTSEFSTEELLEKVATHEIDCTVADSNIYSLNQRYFPNIALAFTISPREHIAWVLAPDSRKLKASMFVWLNTISQSGELSQLKDHYYSYTMFFDYYNTSMFYKRIKTTLPKYQKYFKDAAKRYDIPYSVLAALSYQESHWSLEAQSYTGVRGLMMLTQNTANMLGVKDRTNPKDSVFGGARHLKQMIKDVSVDVQGEDRLKFALAAYNIGMSHIMDAQILAQKMGLNQSVWSDLKIVLPLLSQEKYHKDLKHGYARGSEPVKYVDQIYDYRDILEKNEEVIVVNKKDKKK